MNPTTIVVFVVCAGGAVWAWRSYARRVAAGLGAVSVLPAMTIAQQITLPMLLVVAGLVGVLVWHRWSRTASTVTRWGARARRKAGVASSVDIARKASRRAVCATAATVRPSLAGQSRAQRRRMATSEVAVQLCRVGAQRVWSSIENVTLVFGGPRMGKSAWLVGRILDAPGAILVTSTRADLMVQTTKIRGRTRGPVFVFNAAGFAGIESTITFDPLTGCADPVTAAERAADMIAAGAGSNGSGGDRAYWDGQARRVLAALMHAAALGGRSMADVQSWVADPDRADGQISQLLRQSPEPGFVADAAQFVGTNERTRTSITSTIMPALAWLTHPAAVKAATGSQQFDVAWLLSSKATVYLLGGDDSPIVAPLVCALTGYIAREARGIAARQPGGRLDPPLTLALDEAALICPIPLDRWSADMGGRGVTIIACFQSRSQLIDTYGTAKAATIINNAGSKVLFGAMGDRDDLSYWSTLAGERDEPITTTDLHGRVASRSVRKVPVLAPAQIAQLPKHKVVVFAQGLPPVVGWAEKSWRRPDVRAVLTPTAPSVRARALGVRLAGTVAVRVARLVAPVRTGAARLAAVVGRGWRRAGVLVRGWVSARGAELAGRAARLRVWAAGRWVVLTASVRSWRANSAATPEAAPAAEPAPGHTPTPSRVVVPFPPPWTATPSPAEPGDKSTEGQRRAAGLPTGEWTTDAPNTGGGNGQGGSGVWN